MPAGVGEIGAQRVDEAPGRMYTATVQQDNALRGIAVGRGRLGVEGQEFDLVGLEPDGLAGDEIVDDLIGPVLFALEIDVEAAGSAGGNAKNRSSARTGQGRDMRACFLEGFRKV